MDLTISGDLTIIINMDRIIALKAFETSLLTVCVCTFFSVLFLQIFRNDQTKKLLITFKSISVSLYNKNLYISLFL